MEGVLNLSKYHLKDIAKLLRDLVNTQQGNREDYQNVLNRAHVLLSHSDQETIAEIVRTLRYYNSPIVRKLLEKAATHLTGGFSLFSFGETAEILYTMRGHRVENHDLYSRVNRRLINTCNQPRQEDIARITYWMKNIEEESIFTVFEGEIHKSQYLVNILQGYVTAGKGSESFYNNINHLISSNLNLFTTEEVSIALNTFTVLQNPHSLSLDRYFQYLAQNGSFENWIGAIQDGVALEYDISILVGLACSNLADARTLIELTILEWACSLTRIPIPEALHKQRKIVTFLSTYDQIAKDFFLRYKLKS